MTPAEIFQRYADVYDSFYVEKDYGLECDFLENAFQRWGVAPVQRILDLGCGTGGHALPLARRGYHVCGIDRSAKMLSVARRKALNAGLSDHLQFRLLDACELPEGESFDAVTAMFAVLSYQVSNTRLNGLLTSARRVLVPDGLFVADFWFGPAVVAQQPQARCRELTDSGLRTVRTCLPAWNMESDTIEVTYQIQQFDGDSLADSMHETHPLRYFFLPELYERLSDAGLEPLHACAFPNLSEPPSEQSWNVAVIARAAK